MDNINNILSKIDNDLFSQTDIDLIDEKMEENLTILLDSKEYVKINKQFNNINLKLTSTLTPQQRELLNEYQGLELEITSYQNCLAYYIGLKTKNEVEKLK